LTFGAEVGLFSYPDPEIVGSFFNQQGEKGAREATPEEKPGKGRAEKKKIKGGTRRLKIIVYKKKKEDEKVSQRREREKGYRGGFFLLPEMPGRENRPKNSGITNYST